MAFFASAITTLQTLVIALGAGLGVWGVVNLLEGYGSDNPGSKSQDASQEYFGILNTQINTGTIFIAIDILHGGATMVMEQHDI